jgi:hypothetical protein
MKLNICVNGEYKENYKNIEPRINLDDVVQNAECEEILALNIMDYIPTEIVYNILKHYVSKLRHGGKIILGGTDLVLLSKEIVTGRLNIVEANKMLHGSNGEIKKNGQISLSDLDDILKSLNLKIMKRRIDGIKFYIEGVRE